MEASNTFVISHCGRQRQSREEMAIGHFQFSSVQDSLHSAHPPCCLFPEIRPHTLSLGLSYCKRSWWEEDLESGYSFSKLSQSS